MEVLLVNPPVNRLCEITTNYFPIGIGYLAAYTNKLGYETSIYNSEFSTHNFPKTTNIRRLKNHDLFIRALQNTNHTVWKEFAAIIKRTKPKIIGFSCTSASIQSCLKMASIAKKIINCIIIFGGIHPTILPEQTARAKNVDYIITGEAENSFSNLISVLLDGGNPFSIPGVGGMNNGDFFISPSITLEKDLDQIPFPDRDCILMNNKHHPFLNSIITSRGCPYHCTFCSGRSIHAGFVRYRTIDNVIEELYLIKNKYKLKRVAFYDDSLILDKKRISSLLEKMIQLRLNLSWTGFTRVDSIDKELCELMKKSGCVGLFLGVESGSDKTLSKIKKGYTRDQAIKGVKLALDANIPIGINIIVGFPFENETDLLDTMSLIKELNVYTNINTFTPYIGSELYGECKQRGLIKRDDEWVKISQHSLHNEYVDEISPKRYNELLLQIAYIADNTKQPLSIEEYIRRTIEILRESNYHPYYSGIEIVRKVIGLVTKRAGNKWRARKQ